jgi:hypothetical protein
MFGGGVSMTSLRARVILVQTRRRDLGPPVPTEEYPYPQEGLKCKFCLREYRTTRNPLNNRPNPFLEVRQYKELVATE